MSQPSAEFPPQATSRRPKPDMVFTTTAGWHIHLLNSVPSLSRYAERQPSWPLAANPFCDWAVALHWLKQEPAGVRPFVLAIETPDGRLAGFAPWCVQRNRWGLRRLTGLSGRDTWYHEPTLADAIAGEKRQAHQALCEALKHWRRHFDCLEIDVAAEAGASLLAALHAQGTPLVYQDPWRQHPIIDMGENAAHFEANILGPRRKKERRHMRRLEGVPHRFYCVPPEEILAQLDLLRSWQRGRYAHARDWQSYHVFMQSIIKNALAQNEVLLHALDIDGKVAALDLTLQRGDWAFGLLLSYDEAFKEYSPGNLLAIHLIEQLYLRGTRHLDQGPGCQAWKERLATGKLMFHQVLVPTSPLGWAMAWHKARLKPWLKQQEGLRQLYRNVREGSLLKVRPLSAAPQEAQPQS